MRNTNRINDDLFSPDERALLHPTGVPQSLLHDTRSPKEIAYRILPSGNLFDLTFVPPLDGMDEAIQKALRELEHFIDIKFITSPQPDLFFAFVTDLGDKTGGTAGNLIILNQRNFFIAGSYRTVLHELGHFLGLDHPAPIQRLLWIPRNVNAYPPHLTRESQL